jgi:hypothetical protein
MRRRPLPWTACAAPVARSSTGGALAAAALPDARAALRARLQAGGGVVVLLPARVPAPVQGVLAEALEDVADGAHVIAISPEAAPEPALQALFGLRLATSRLVAPLAAAPTQE